MGFSLKKETTVKPGVGGQVVTDEESAALEAKLAARDEAAAAGIPVAEAGDGLDALQEQYFDERKMGMGTGIAPAAKTVTITDKTESTGSIGFTTLTDVDRRISSAIADLHLKLMSEIQIAASPLHQGATNTDGISAVLIAAEFNCPKCGRRLGHTGHVYEHDFAQDNSGRQCDLKGQKFKAPVVFLARIPNKLTPKA